MDWSIGLLRRSRFGSSSCGKGNRRVREMPILVGTVSYGEWN